MKRQIIVSLTIPVGIAAVAGAYAPFALAADRSLSLEEVVVTAQRREQNLQDVPVAVTALTSDMIEDSRITNVEDLSSLAPNTWIQPAAGGNNVPIINIRGVVGGNGTLGADSPVAIYVDGVAIGDFFGITQDVADIERIEVLRGPQGTLFGRNSTGGAISFTTASPTGELGGKVSASLGNFDSERYRARIDLPEFRGVSLQASVLHSEKRGHVRNQGAGTTFDWTNYTFGDIGTLTASDTLGGHDFDAFHLAADWDINERLQVAYRYDLSDGEYEGEAFQVLGFNDGSGTTQFLFAESASVGAPIAVSRNRLSSVNNELSTAAEQRVDAHSVTVTYELTDKLSVKNILAYRDSEYDAKSNQLDGAGGLRISPTVSAVFGGVPTGPAMLLGITAQTRDIEQLTNELQFIWSSDRLDLIAGHFYYDSDVEELPARVGFLRFAPGFVPTFSFTDGPTINGISKGDIESKAFFGQGTWHATDKLDLTLGARRTKDEKEILDANSSPTPFDFSGSQTDYMASASYEIRDGILGYFKVSTGYQAGGVANGRVYSPEEVISYELGMKAELMNRRIVLNTAVYYSDYQDLQFAFVDPQVGPVTANAAEAEIQGVELELNAAVTDRITLSGNLGYSDFEYKELNPLVGDVDTYRPTLRPEWTSSLALDWDIAEFANGIALRFQADAQYNSNTLFAANRLAVEPGLDSAVETGNVWLLNSRLTLDELRIGESNVSLSAWVKNLTDDDSLTSANDLGTVVSGSFREPRTYGFDVKLEF